MVKIKSAGLLALAVLIAQVIVSYLYKLFLGTSTQQLFSISPYTGIGSQVIGDKLLGYLSGIIPFTFSWIYLISMFIGAFVLIYAGTWIYERNWAWKGKDLTQRLFAMLLYGHVVLYAALLLLKMGTVQALAIPLAIGLGINLALVSLLITFSAKQFNFPRI